MITKQTSAKLLKLLLTVVLLGSCASPNSKTETTNTLTQSCTNEAVGYTVRYPAGWKTNSGNLTKPCEIFDPESAESPEPTDSIEKAIYLRADRVPFEQAAESEGERVLSRQTATIDGHQAVIVESESTGEALLPEGYRYYSYKVDLGNQTLIAITYKVKEQDYQRNQKILDHMMKSLEIN